MRLVIETFIGNILFDYSLYNRYVACFCSSRSLATYARAIDSNMINTENIVDLAELDTELVYLAMAFSTIESNQQVVDFSAVERALGEKFMRYKPEIHLAVKVGETFEHKYTCLTFLCFI